MTMKEFYEEIGGDYEDALGRFRDDERLERFLRLFLADPSFDALVLAVEKENWEEAFRAAHTMKGTAGNMGFTSLQKSVSALTEALRGGNVLMDRSLYETVCREYQKILAKSGELS